MRAVVWLFGCLALLWWAHTLHLWRMMFEMWVTLVLWLWIFGGAFWVSRGPHRRRPLDVPLPREADALQRAAQKAAELQREDRSGPMP
jgi:hypothetical protein